MNVVRVITATTVGAALVLGGTVACGGQYDDETVTVEEYEDCDVEDQQKHETDCGYWQHPGGADVAVADHQMDASWVWIWYPWVIPGRTSRPPVAWRPPTGIKPPVRIVKRPKSQACSMAFVTDVLVAPVPPKPPAPKAPVNNPPKVNQPAKPAKPGIRPAGC